MRRTFVCIGIVGLLAGAAILGVSAPRLVASIEAPEKPNVVLIVTDDQSFGSQAAMSFLTSKPGGHWIEFTNGFLNTPLCCPTRATLLTGLYPHHHGVQTNHQAGNLDDSSTLATWLQSAGYRTGLAGKYLNNWPWGGLSAPPGWSDWFANVKTTGYYDYSMSDNGAEVSFGQDPEDYHTDVVAARADQFIRSSGEDPFFLYVAPIAPHAPIQTAPRHGSAPVTITHPPNFNEEDVSDKPAWVQAMPSLTDKQVIAMDRKHGDEFRAVMAVDDLVATVYQALDETARLDDTVIVFMTDNGFLFGEHRGSGKNCVYEECVRTPMYVRYPWVEGRQEAGLISSIDIAPTIADLAGIVPPDPVDGTSFVPLVEDAGADWRSSILLQYHAESNKPPFWGIRTNEWKYVELATGERELYDMTNDSFELENVAGLPEHAALQAELAAELEVLRTAPPTGGDPTPTPSPSPTSTDTPTPTPTETPSPSPTPTSCRRSCDPTPSPSPTSTESPSPSPTPTCRRFC